MSDHSLLIGFLQTLFLFINVMIDISQKITVPFISLTSVVVKVLEHMIRQQLYSALRENGLLSHHQYGFQRNRSTVTLLLQAVDDWSLSLEHRESIHCLFLDYAKAFDSVPHECLLLILESLRYVVICCSG